MSEIAELQQDTENGTSLRKDRADHDGINWVTATAMILFHLGAVAALFFFTWKAFFVACFLWLSNKIINFFARYL